ncbi:Nn.00g098910.m01.CDS01 [Neocucurbitaria sp. VM-36]
MNLPNCLTSSVNQGDSGNDVDTGSMSHRNTSSISIELSPPSTPSGGHDGVEITAKLKEGRYRHTTPLFNIAESSREGGELSHSDETATDEGLLQPIGKWRCCKCHKGHDIYDFAQGVHPASILNCVCTHRSCSSCTLDGLIKKFQPMNEPEVVQLSEDGSKQVRFGVFCDGCGLSWRAQGVGEELSKKSTLHRISTLPKRLAKRGVHPLEKLRHARSMSNLSSLQSEHSLPATRSTLNLRALSNEMAKGHGKQAELATVKFTGIHCTCGLVTDASSLCFQIVDSPKYVHPVKVAKMVAEPSIASFKSTPEDQAKGHGTPMLTLKGGQHVNPLMSNPVK